MKDLNISMVTPEMLKDLAACKTEEEMKAYFLSKDLNVSDAKLKYVAELMKKGIPLDLEDLEQVSGGACEGGPGCWSIGG